MSLSNGSLSPGTVIDDKFRIEKVLGEGAVGIVVRALHLKLGTPVALKFLLPRMLNDAIVVERFAREARAAARMTSEHVARVLDVGNVQQGAPYMVMEYLSGETLSDAMKRRRIIPIAEACSYMMQVCDALTEAHAMGIIHRDLKPANLFLSVRPNGRTVVKVLDFGISKISGGAAALTSSNEKLPPEGAELTMASSILGTPLYMAPEQIASSRTVDGRADVWSCGIVLHRMLCGKVPFDAGSLIELGAKLIKERAPRLDVLRPDIPVDLANVVLRCLERDVAKRWQSAADLGNALSRWVIPAATSGASPALSDDDDGRPGDLTLAIRQAAKIPVSADQAETMTIVSGTARTVMAGAEDPIEEITLKPMPVPAVLRPPPAAPAPPGPVLGVKRRSSKPAPPIVTTPPPLSQLEDEAELHSFPYPHHETRVASGPLIAASQHHQQQQQQQQLYQQQHGSSYAPPAQHGSRSAPTVPTGVPVYKPSVMDQVERHPYFGVGICVLLGLLIFVIVLFARQSGCL